MLNRLLQECRLPLLPLVLAASNIAGNENGHDTEDNAQCEECEKLLTGIGFNPSFVCIGEQEVFNEENGKAIEARFEGEGTANWTIAEPPSSFVIKSYDWSPRQNGKITRISLVGADIIGKRVQEPDDPGKVAFIALGDFPTKFGITAVPLGEDKFLLDSRWLSIYGKQARLELVVPPHVPARLRKTWKPVGEPGEVVRYRLKVVNVVDSSDWNFDLACRVSPCPATPKLMKVNNLEAEVEVSITGNYNPAFPQFDVNVWADRTSAGMGRRVQNLTFIRILPPRAGV